MAYNPPIGSIYHLYTTYILPSGGLYATYHLLGEPETTIEVLERVPVLLAVTKKQRLIKTETSRLELFFHACSYLCCSMHSNFPRVATSLKSTKKLEKSMRYLDVSKNSGIPKWMVYNGKPY